MRRQLQVVVALAMLVLSIAAATAAAGSLNLGSGSGDVSIDLPGGEDLEPVGPLPACSNLKDDDGDGQTDLLDAGCAGPLDDDEADPVDDPDLPLPGDGGGGEEPTDPGHDNGGETPVEPSPGDTGPGAGGSGRGEVEADKKSDGEDGEVKGNRDPLKPEPDRNPDGTPTNSNPTVTIADFGPAPIGVPNFVIDQFTIPPFLLPIYQACGTEYGIPWEVLASINRIETAFGTNLNVSSAGALGWMQFIPSSWQAYGVDANNDGRKDPYNPVDAICAAARYLKAAGGQEDLSRAIFAYNRADWYVDEVLLYARQYGKIPADLVGSLTGLTEGARFPVAANARYADDISEREALARSKPGKGSGNAADVFSDSPTRRGINIYAREGAPVVAVNDGVVRKIGRSKKLGRYLILEDNYGNRFTYAQLGRVAEVYPVPKERRGVATAYSEGDEPRAGDESQAGPERRRGGELANTEDSRERLFAFPERQADLTRMSDPGQQALEQIGYETFRSQFGPLEFDPKKMELRQLREGANVVAGTVLGEVGGGGDLAPHLHFQIQPAGRGAPKIDPKPILDGWKLLEATAIYRAAGRDPFADSAATTGQVLLMSKEQAARELLDEPKVSIYECGRQDVASGQIDVRVMRLLLYLARTGFRITVTSLKCGHSVYTSSGNISAHSVGSAVDIAQINGLPVLGNQGGGSITEALIKQVLQLQGTMVPDQVISLMEMGGPTFAMGDHADHVHVGFSITGAEAPEPDDAFVQVLEADQWRRLIERLGQIENPEVRVQAPRRASVAHRAE